MLRSILRVAGSLWFAAVLLVLLLVGMACATIYEVTHGTQQALDDFYYAMWFTVLLGLLGVNALASIIMRFPFKRAQLGFAVTHLAILVILAGAWVTQQFGVRGQVALAIGESATHFNTEDGAITLRNTQTGATTTLNLIGSAFKRNQVLDLPNVPPVKLDDVSLKMTRFIPDSVWEQAIEASNDPAAPPAVKVAIGPAGEVSRAWVQPTETAQVGPFRVALRVVGTKAELEKLRAAATTAAKSTSVGRLDVKYNGQTLSLPVENFMETALPLADSEFSLRVLRYLPHAQVSREGETQNASDKPVNPAVEYEIIGPDTREKRTAFAKFPTFKLGEYAIEAVDVVFTAEAADAPRAPIEVVLGPGNTLFLRYDLPGASGALQSIEPNRPIETPLPKTQLTVTQVLEHATAQLRLVPTSARSESPTEGVMFELSTPQEQMTLGIQRFHSRGLQLGGGRYELAFVNRIQPLGFTLALDDFRVGRYPGTGRPRSFESRVTTREPQTGREQSRVISMNLPATVGGYTLFQSSYRERNDGPDVSIFSVARDPGQIIVFAGYMAILLGMLIVLYTRLTEKKMSEAGAG